jgi:CelD/BcsL family acetyltransferase involved in cellulose biosynthesis
MRLDGQVDGGEDDSSDMPVPYYLSDAWFDAWFAAFGDGPQRSLQVAEGKLHYVTESRRLGLLPVRVARGATNLQTPYFDIAGTSDIDAADETPRRLLALTRSDMVEFDFIAENSLLFRAAKHWTSTGRALIELRARTALLDCTGEIEDWLAGRSSAHSKNWLKGEKKLNRLGARFELITDHDEIRESTEELLALEDAGWKGRAGSSILSNAKEAAFYRALASGSAAAGSLRVALLRYEGRMIAAELCIVDGENCIALKTTYNEAFSSKSAGFVVMLMHLRELFRTPRIRWYDQLGNGLTPPEHKLRTATHLLPVYRIRYFAPTWRGLALREYHRAYEAAKRARRSRRPVPPLLQRLLDESPA